MSSLGNESFLQNGERSLGLIDPASNSLRPYLGLPMLFSSWAWYGVKLKISFTEPITELHWKVPLNFLSHLVMGGSNGAGVLDLQIHRIGHSPAV